MKEEYLIYQAECTHQRQIVESSDRAASIPPAPVQAPLPPNPHTPLMSISHKFPPNRLLFLRNLPPDINKTAIKNEMAGVLGEKSGVDYVDWVKGSDSVRNEVTFLRVLGG